MSEVGERELLAILFTDAVGSSNQTARDEDKSLSMLMADLDFIRNEAGVRGGVVLKNTGDGLLISFKSAVDAVECSLAIQKSFQSRPKKSGFQHKIGVHIGDVIKKNGDIYGVGVNTASRLTDQCHPGEICISSTLFELTKQKSEIGRLKLKDYLLQNTDPPTLAYQSQIFEVISKETAGKNLSFLKTPPKQKRKELCFLIGAAVVSLVAIVIWQQAQTRKEDSKNSKLYGFQYRPGKSDDLKSAEHGSPIEFTLENNTDQNLELRWFDSNGKQKMPDNPLKEYADLGPGKQISHALSSLGDTFALFDLKTEKMLGAFRFLSGQKLYLVAEKDGDLIRVEPRNLKKALNGDARAQAILSEMFFYGNGVPQNDKEALHYATLSFNQGNSYGVCMMAALLDKGSVIPTDRQRATKLWQEAANAGEPWAYARLGDRYLYGFPGIPKDYVEAFRWLSMASERGNAWATANLGKCFENGWGVPPDHLQARKLYQVAVAADSTYPIRFPEATQYLKEMLQKGPIPEVIGGCKLQKSDFSLLFESSGGLAFYRWPKTATRLKFAARVESPTDLSLLISGPGSTPVYAKNNNRETLNAILGGWKNSKSIFQLTMPGGKENEIGSSTRLGALPEAYDCEALYGPEGWEIRVDGKKLIETNQKLISNPEFFSIGTCQDANAKLSNILIEFY